MGTQQVVLDPSPNKLVQARIADAQQNLGLIDAVVKRAAKRRDDLNKTFSDLQALRGNFGPLDALFPILEKALEKLDPITVQQLKRQMDSAKENLDMVKEKIDRSLQELASEKPCCHRQQIAEHATWTEDFVDKKRRYFNVLSLQSDPDFRKRLAEIELNKPFWGEHIEAVAGLLLRDGRFDGFDGRLCEFADALIDICKKEIVFKKRTLNVLGHECLELRDLSHAGVRPLSSLERLVSAPDSTRILAFSGTRAVTTTRPSTSRLRSEIRVACKAQS